MTLKSDKDIGKEANAPARRRASASESPRLQNDAFSRRGFSPDARTNASPATSTRALNHRPSPLVLPPLPPSDFIHSSRSQHSNDKRSQDEDGDVHHANDDCSTSPGSATSQRGQKRLYTPDSDIEEDYADCQVDSYSSVDDDAENERANVVSTSGPKSSLPNYSRCVCLRPKKIPRPRNVFMLYRQQTHADVLAEHPGIANPIISKIIGKRWRSMSDEEKIPWNKLAEKEKRLHREMYPNYRYQPKRARKANGGESSSPGGIGSKGPGNGSSSDRCERCGLLYVAPPNSARPIPSSARTPRPQPSPFGAAQGRTEPVTPGAFGKERGRYSAPFPSPGYLPPRQPSSSSSSPYGQRHSSRDAHGRRSLPPGSHHGTRYPEHHGQPDYRDGALAMPFHDEARRQYGPPTSYATNYPPNVAVESGKHHQYTLPHRPRHYDDSPLPPQLPHSATLPPFPAPASDRSSSFSWMGPPPLPVRQPAGGYAANPPSVGEPSTPRSGHMDRAGGYGIPSNKLPQPVYDAQGYYYPRRCSVSGDVRTPSTAMAGLSMHQTQTPTPITPSFGRAMDPGKVAASNRERMLYQMNPRATSGYTDESLELPPLMTGVPPVLQSARQGYTDTIMVDSQGGSSIPSSQPPLHTPAQSGGPSTAHAHIQDMQMSASTLMPTLPAGSKDTQASGFRAMIMSISHLKKLEVLRRICPPKPLSPKRGPIIAIEGHNAALRVAVGRAVEKALVQSGVCNVIARTAMNLDGKHSNVASGCESKLQKSLAQDSLAFDVSAIFECMVLVSQVQKASSAIMQHVTSATSHLVPRSSARPASPTPAGPPPPLPATSTSPKPTDCSPTSLSPTIHVATLSEIDGVSEAVPATVSLHSTPPPLPPSPLLPVALLTTGFSLAVADKCAVSVDIDDSFGPVDHWEYMATMWRGTPGPDLVVYADASPPPSAAKGGSRPTVHTVEQEGVLVVHVPLADSGGENNADSRDGGIDADHGGVVIDQKTERRLAFEVMEFVRSGKFGVAVSEK